MSNLTFDPTSLSQVRFVGNVATEKGGAALLTSFGNFRLATKGGSLHAEGNSAREGGAFLVELQSQLTLPPESSLAAVREYLTGSEMHTTDL
eukprot:582749-Pyramimonas_sp.AAC.1